MLCRLIRSPYDRFLSNYDRQTITRNRCKLYSDRHNGLLIYSPEMDMYLSSGLELSQLRSQPSIEIAGDGNQPNTLASIPSLESKSEITNNRIATPLRLSSTIMMNKGLWENLLSQKIKSNIDYELKKSTMSLEAGNDQRGSLVTNSRPSTASSSSRPRSAKKKRRAEEIPAASKPLLASSTSFANTLPTYLPFYEQEAVRGTITQASTRPRSASPSLKTHPSSVEGQQRIDAVVNASSGQRPSSAGPSSSSQAQGQRTLANNLGMNPRNLLRQQLMSSVKSSVDLQDISASATRDDTLPVAINEQDKQAIEDEFTSLVETLQSIKANLSKKEDENAMLRPSSANPTKSRPVSASRNNKRAKSKDHNAFTRRISQNKDESLQQSISRHYSIVDRQYEIFAKVNTLADPSAVYHFADVINDDVSALGSEHARFRLRSQFFVFATEILR
jgi:hypothetical protein